MRLTSSRYQYSFAILLLAMLPAARAADMELQPFSSDGCSAFLNRSPMDRKKDWCMCCFNHDLAYWRGGSAEERLKADEVLKACVMEKTNNPALADAMFNAVRVGGAPEFLTTYRWAYGWPMGRNYTALSTEEATRADELQAEYLARNSPTLTCPIPPK